MKTEATLISRHASARSFARRTLAAPLVLMFALTVASSTAAKAAEPVDRALRWIESQRSADGTWKDTEGKLGTDAVTALTVVAFVNRTERFDRNSLRSLTRRMRSGNFGDVPGTLFEHALVTWGLIHAGHRSPLFARTAGVATDALQSEVLQIEGPLDPVDAGYALVALAFAHYSRDRFSIVVKTAPVDKLVETLRPIADSEKSDAHERDIATACLSLADRYLAEASPLEDSQLEAYQSRLRARPYTLESPLVYGLLGWLATEKDAGEPWRRAFAELELADDGHFAVKDERFGPIAATAAFVMMAPRGETTKPATLSGTLTLPSPETYDSMRGFLEKPTILLAHENGGRDLAVDPDDYELRDGKRVFTIPLQSAMPGQFQVMLTSRSPMFRHAFDVSIGPGETKVVSLELPPLHEVNLTLRDSKADFISWWSADNRRDMRSMKAVEGGRFAFATTWSRVTVAGVGFQKTLELEVGTNRIEIE